MTLDEARAEAGDRLEGDLGPGLNSPAWCAGFDAGWAAREAEYAAQDEREIKRLIEDELL